MVNNSDIQKFIVQSLLTFATDTSLLPDNTEIREDSWHGLVYAYPNVRAKVLQQSIEDEPTCSISYVDMDILINSEEPSSDQCNTIAFKIADYLNKKTIGDTTITNDSIKRIKCTVRTLGGAESVGEIWLVRIQLNLMVTSK